MIALHMIRRPQVVSLVLSGTRALLFWRREVERSTTKLDDLGRSWVWVKALCSADLKLREGSLWGNCLASLTAKATHPLRAESQIRQSSQPASNQRPLLGNRRVMSAGGTTPPAEAEPEAARPPKVNAPMTIAQPPAEPRAHQRIAHVSTLPHQASLRLLGRLVAGQELSSRPRAERHHPTISFSDKARPSPRAPRAKIKAVGEDAQQAVRYSWHDHLARRALRRVGSSHASSAAQDQLALARQWSAPIAGPTVPPELLIRIVDLARSEVSAVSGVEHLRTTFHPESSAIRDVEDLQEAIRPVSGQDQLEFGSRLGRPVDQGERPTGRSSGSVAQTTIRAAAQDESFAIARITPPTTTSILPPLVPPDASGVLISPVAAASAEKAAWAEAADAKDDLSVLSAKIKRILDTEARRYGIDV